MILNIPIFFATGVFASISLLREIDQVDFSTFPKNGVHCGPKTLGFDVSQSKLMTAVVPHDDHALTGIIYEGRVTVDYHVVLVKYTIEEDKKNAYIKYGFKGAFEQVGDVIPEWLEACNPAGKLE